MSTFIAALPMYDWPESRAEVDAQWVKIRDRLLAKGVDAPDRLARRNADMPALPGGIRDCDGTISAPDPAALPPGELDLPTLWRHPRLICAQTCWGPLETTDLGRHVQVIGQPDYSGIEGGNGDHYSSAIVMRRTSPELPEHRAAPADGTADLPLHRLRGLRLAFNGHDSMSGIIALTRDLEASGETIGMFSERNESGGHRLSIIAVAAGRADVAAIDCRSWDLARRFEPAAAALEVVGWTTHRKGLPFITAKNTPAPVVASLREALRESGLAVNDMVTD